MRLQAERWALGLMELAAERRAAEPVRELAKLALERPGRAGSPHSLAPKRAALVVLERAPALVERRRVPGLHGHLVRQRRHHDRGNCAWNECAEAFRI